MQSVKLMALPFGALQRWADTASSTVSMAAGRMLPAPQAHTQHNCTAQGSLGNLLKSGGLFSRYAVRPSLPSSL